MQSFRQSVPVLRDGFQSPALAAMRAFLGTARTARYAAFMQKLIADRGVVPL